MTLRATTLLADNTIPLLHSVCSSLRESGVSIEFDESIDLGDRTRLVENEQVDLVWACGLLTARLIEAGVGLHVVAAPVFPGEHQPVYRSAIVCRSDAAFESVDDALQARVAINDLGSWSGWHGLVSYMREPPHVVLATGGHIKSIQAVALREADVAAIDSSVWNHAASEDPDSVVALRVLRTIGDWPAPPLSVLLSPPSADSQLHNALVEAIGDLADFRSASIADYEFMLDAFGRTPEVTIRTRQV